MQVLEIGGFERHSAAEHRKKEHAQGPDVNKEALVPLVYDNLRREVGRGSALLLNDLAFLNDLGDTKVADLYSLLAVEEDIV